MVHVESWRTGSGEYRERKNRINIEVVGRDSAMVADKARLGGFVSLEGYIRSEQFKGQAQVKVRTLIIHKVWEDVDGGPA